MKKRFVLVFACVLAFFSAVSADEWRTHSAYTDMTLLAQSAEKVYALSNGSLFSVDKEYESIELYSKVTGLSDTKISYIAYSDKFKLLVICYDNGNIDLLFDDGSVHNIRDIARKNMIADKRVNHILFKDDFACLSCDFGIVMLNLKREEIADSYYIGENGNPVAVLSMAYFQGSFYAITADSLYRGDEKTLLVNYENWENVSEMSVGKKKKVVVFAGSVWLLKQDGFLYQYDGTSWRTRNDLGTFSMMSLCGDNLLLVTLGTKIKKFDKGMNETTLSGFSAKDVVFDYLGNNYWIAEKKELVKADAKTKEKKSFIPNGPITENVWKMAVFGNKLFVVPGGRWASEYARPGYVMLYENREWTDIPHSEMVVVPENTTILKTLNARDLVDIEIDPKDSSHFFVAAYGLGLYEFRKNKFYKLHNAENSAIESIFPDKYPTSSYFYYTRVDALAFDVVGNLWFANTQVGSPVKYLTPKGVVKPFYMPEIGISIATVQDLLVSTLNTNQKWLIVSRDEGTGEVFVFDDNGTLDNPSDDKRRMFTSFVDQDGKNSFPQYVLCAAQDKNGAIWIGTSSGLFTVPNPKDVFKPEFTFQRIKIPRNDGTDDADYLFDNERINYISVDGANRKWIATESSGVYLVSADGLETIHHFTTENSPLPSDNIVTLISNNRTGEVFFGTGKGIVSYKSDAVEPSENLDNVVVYPNPVREDYQGMINISGLVEKTNVKVIDVAGNVVYETTSVGGLATWDGLSANGNRLNTGVYTAVCTTNSKKVYARVKLLVIN